MLLDCCFAVDPLRVIFKRFGGGTVASISAIHLMLHLGKNTDLAVFNITFGSPFFANETVRKKCKEERFDQRMIHYVGHKDIVPGVLSLGHMVAELQRRLNEVTGIYSFIQRDPYCRKHLFFP